MEGLNQANQNDPFIQCMIGQTYEKLGDRDKALEVLSQSIDNNGAQSCRRICSTTWRNNFASAPTLLSQH